MKGITLPCSQCKDILLRYANIKGDGSFEMLCPHCQTLNVIHITQKSVITSTLKILVTAFVILSVTYFSVFLSDKGVVFVADLFQ